MVVGWYHSHPGFGCWLSGVDVNTQQSFEALNARAVAVVIDPIQSVKGKVVIDAFRCISPQTMMLGQEARQTTSNIGHLNKPSIQACMGEGEGPGLGDGGMGMKASTGSGTLDRMPEAAARMRVLDSRRGREHVALGCKLLA